MKTARRLCTRLLRFRAIAIERQVGNDVVSVSEGRRRCDGRTGTAGASLLS